MPKSKRNPDRDHIEKIAGYKSGRAAWDQLELHGLQWLFGFDEGAAPTENDLDEMSGAKLRRFIQNVKDTKVRCERYHKGNQCGSGYNLVVCIPDRDGQRKPWEYQVKETMLLCRSCLKEEQRERLHIRRMAKSREVKKAPNGKSA